VAERSRRCHSGACRRTRDEDRCTRFDRIVVETSGLTDPAPILQTLMTAATALLLTWQHRCAADLCSSLYDPRTK
jgi:G3E family GTPase